MRRSWCLLFAAALLGPLAGAAAPTGFLGKSLARWAEDLASSDARVRRSAAFALGKCGPLAVGAAPKLVRALKDREARVREAAAYALGEIGPTGWDDTYPALIESLAGDGSPLVRRSAAFALGSLGRQAPPADKGSAGNLSAALEKALADPDAAVRQNAAWALGRLKAATAVRRLSEVLADSDPLVRRDTAAALGELGAAARSAAPALVGRIEKEKDATVRKIVLNTLVELVGPEDHSVAAALRPALRDPELAWPAALVIANVGGAEAAPAVPILCEALLKEDAGRRQVAAAALSRLGPHAVAGVPSLAKALADRDPIVRRNAALALGGIGTKASAAVPALTAALASTEPEEVRQYAAEALARISPGVEPAVPVLLRLLKDDGNWRVRQRTVWALARLDDPEKAGAYPALDAVLRETDPETRLVRYDAAVALGVLLGPRASDRNVDVLQALLEDRQIQLYSGTDAKVSGAGTESRAGETAVAAKLSGDCRGLAAQALARIGKKANRPEIIRALKDASTASDAAVRQAASDALRKIQE